MSICSMSKITDSTTKNDQNTPTACDVKNKKLSDIIYSYDSMSV